MKNVSTASRTIGWLVADGSASRIDVDDPSSVTPTNDELLGPSGLLVRQTWSDDVVGVMTIWISRGVIFSLQSPFVDPLNARLPNTSHVIPVTAVWPVYVANAFPGRLGVGRFESEMGAHDLDAVIVDPGDKFGRGGKLDGPDTALTRVQHSVFS